MSLSRFWWKPQDIEETADVFATRVDLIAGRTDVLSEFVEAISNSIQFPRSTAYLHALGVMSAAMVESFFYSFNGKDDNTVALYTAGVQPPSTGKSGINEYLSEPISHAYRDKAKSFAAVRIRIEKQIAGLEKDLKSAIASGEIEHISRELMKLQDEIKQYPDYKFSSNDPTPEGCEKLVTRNSGFCNVVSDESAAIKVILGIVYGNGAGSGNNGIFLRLWDNGYLSVDRASREGFEGKARGSVALLAQDAAIESILEAGQLGEGISERFLIIREKNMLGRRDHTKYKPVTQSMRDAYIALINNIVNMNYKIVFSLSKEAEKLVREMKQNNEPLMADGAKFSSPMLRGVVGKDEKQILKIASVLHCVENWCDKGNKKTVIEIKTIIEASMIFNQLLQTYVAAADSKGFTGEKTEIKFLIDLLSKWSGKNITKITVRKIRDSVHKIPQFGGENLTDKIKNDYLPKLEKLAYLVYDTASGDIFLNPRLKD